MKSKWIKYLNFKPETLKLLGTLKDAFQDTEERRDF